MIWIKILVIAVLSLIAEYVYFVIAEKYEIVDKPNHRTLHVDHTIRGGGIIFPLGVVFYFLLFGVSNWLFATGLLLISLVSFIDDLGHVKTIIRVSSQLLSIVLICWQIGFLSWDWWWFPLIVIVSTGILNAYNFMDGINGITGGYSLVAISTLIFINYQVISFESSELLWVILIAIMIFNFFNFRHKARCFAGDVGSISISFLIVYFILKLIFLTGNFIYILLLVVYGIDTVLTILQRLINKENIFEAHRSHLFQVIVHQSKMPHLKMTVIYMALQLLINLAILQIISFPFSIQIFLSILILLILSIVYVMVKIRYLKMT